MDAQIILNSHYSGSKNSAKFSWFTLTAREPLNCRPWLLPGVRFNRELLSDAVGARRPIPSIEIGHSKSQGTGHWQASAPDFGLFVLGAPCGSD